MLYWSYEMNDKVDVKTNELLQKHFPTKEWGCDIDFENDKVCRIGIDKVVCNGTGRHHDGQTWTHYANIQLWDDGTWEVNSQFMGEKEDEMWVYAYYKRLADAVKCVATGKFETMKPIKVY